MSTRSTVLGALAAAALAFPDHDREDVALVALRAVARFAIDRCAMAPGVFAELAREAFDAEERADERERRRA